MSKIPCAVVLLLTLAACNGQAGASVPPVERAPAPQPSGMPPLDHDNIVSIALRSPDHTTLVTALRAADYVVGVANPGPLTVFAPTNAAFAQLPAGTVENLLKPESASDLRHILQHHVVPSVYGAAELIDGQSLGMVDGTRVTVHVDGTAIMIDEAHVVASIRASNGIVHVIDKVLVPPAGH